MHYPLGQAPCGRLFVVKILSRLKFGGEKKYNKNGAVKGRSQPELGNQPVVCVNQSFMLSDWSDRAVSEVLW